MKKLILILSFFLVAISVNAQDKIISGYGIGGANFIVDVGANHGFATHKLLHNSAKIVAYNYTFQVNVSGPYYYAYQVHLRDYESGTGNTATVILKGSLDNIQYVALDTVSYASVADSLKAIKGPRDNYLINDGAVFRPPCAYKFLRLMVTPVGDSIWVKSLWLNILPIK
jgi:hypothetical protein